MDEQNSPAADSAPLLNLPGDWAGASAHAASSSFQTSSDVMFGPLRENVWEIFPSEHAAGYQRRPAARAFQGSTMLVRVPWTQPETDVEDDYPELEPETFDLDGWLDAIVETMQPMLERVRAVPAQLLSLRRYASLEAVSAALGSIGRPNREGVLAACGLILLLVPLLFLQMSGRLSTATRRLSGSTASARATSFPADIPPAPPPAAVKADEPAATQTWPPVTPAPVAVASPAPTSAPVPAKEPAPTRQAAAARPSQTSKPTPPSPSRTNRQPQPDRPPAAVEPPLETTFAAALPPAPVSTPTAVSAERPAGSASVVLSTARAPESNVAALASRPRSAAVQTVINQYRDAFNALDPAAARAVWPSVDSSALKRAFGQLHEQAFAFDDCQISVIGERAVASCGGTLRYVPKVGNRQARVERRQWEFNLREAGEGWAIETVVTR